MSSLFFVSPPEALWAMQGRKEQREREREREKREAIIIAVLR